MKKIITNMEVEKYLKIVSAKDSFRNNTALKIPGALDWSLRVNLKKLNEIYALYEEARIELGQRYISEGKVENDFVKPEYKKDYQNDLVELLEQESEIDIRPLKIKDFIDIPLSMPEKDFMLYMCDENEVNKYFEENSSEG